MRTELLLADDKGVMMGPEQDVPIEVMDILADSVVEQTLDELNPAVPCRHQYDRAARHAAKLGILEGFKLGLMKSSEADTIVEKPEVPDESNDSIIAAALFLGGISRKNADWDRHYAMVSMAIDMAAKGGDRQSKTSPRTF